MQHHIACHSLNGPLTGLLAMNHRGSLYMLKLQVHSLALSLTHLHSVMHTIIFNSNTTYVVMTSCAFSSHPVALSTFTDPEGGHPVKICTTDPYEAVALYLAASLSPRSYFFILISVSFF